MSKRFRFLLAFIPALAALSGCAGGSGTDVTTESEDASGPVQSDENWVDYVNGTDVRLGLDYKNVTFLEQGVSEVSLYTHIDGDTTHFYTKDGQNTYVAARYSGINTPESTNDVDPWGAEASNFVHEILNEASANGTIVISSQSMAYGTPQQEANERYLCLVWVNLTEKECDYKDLVCLNLWIVQEGFSAVGDLEGVEDYKPTFDDAYDQAVAYKLHMWSGEPAPLYDYGDYKPTSLLALKREYEKEIADPTYVSKYKDKKVMVQGTVVAYANNNLFIQSLFREEDLASADSASDSSEEELHVRYDYGEYAGLCIYSLKTPPTKFTTPGTYIQVCGTIQDSDTFGFQMSGASFPIVSTSDADAKVIFKADENTEYQLYTFQYTASELGALVTNKDYECLNCSVEVTDPITITGGYASDNNGNITLYTDYGFSIYLSFPYSPDDGLTTWREVSYFEGKSFLVKGPFAAHLFSSGVYRFQIIPDKSSSFVCQDTTDTSSSSSSEA